MVESQSVMMLTEDEDQALARCETTIEHGLQTFYAVGNALVEIRDERLYRATHRAFEDYCQERWGMTRQHANRLIAAAETVKNLEPIGSILPSYPLPTAESQIRSLTNLAPEQQIGAWTEAVGRSGGQPTAAIVEQVAKEWQPPRIVQVAPMPETADLIGDGIDDALDPPIEPAQVVDMPRPRVNAGLFTSATPEWYTPQHIIARVVKVFGEIDLDPCSNSREAPNVPALNHYTAADDGLAREWFGRVYMNPPYGDEIPQWVDRLVQAYEGEEINAAIALVPGRIDTNWFRPLWAYAICAVYGRLRFSGAENSAPFPSVIVYMGPDVELFKEAFEDIGHCGILR
jgi:hypothetical protein